MLFFPFLAGTEAKVARVLKRGIEVHELAQIEAVEMTADGQRPPKLAALARSHTAEGTQSPPKPLPPPPTATATATAESQAEAESVSDAASVDSNVTSASATAAKDNTFLGRFKRMSFKPKDMAFKPPANMLKAPSFAAAFKAPTFGKPSMAPAVDVASAPDAAAAAAAAGLAAQAPAQTLGMFKTEAPSGLDETPIGKHAAGYVWSVRKFLRPDLEGKEQLLDMSVEWKKRRLGKAGGRPGRASKSNVAPSSEAAVSAPSTPTLGRASMDAATPQAPGSPSASSSKTPEPSQLLQARQQTAHQSRRSSIISTRSGVGEGPAAAAAHTEEEDSGDESDPDDSESPWICELVLPPPTTMIDVPPHSTRRIRLGVFKPAPHHPRLVGQVSIPLSLRRVSLGLPRDPDDEKAGSETISAEEMKDLLCITLLWMTIRESLGGVARTFSCRLSTLRPVSLTSDVFFLQGERRTKVLLETYDRTPLHSDSVLVIVVVLAIHITTTRRPLVCGCCICDLSIFSPMTRLQIHLDEPDQYRRYEGQALATQSQQLAVSLCQV